MRRGLGLLLAAVAVAVAATGCGGGDGGGEAADPAGWAAGFCQALTRFTEGISESGEGLEGEGLPSGEAVVGAVRSAAEAAGTFADELRELGAPDVASGEEIADVLTGAARDAEAAFREAEDEVGGEITSATDVAVQAGEIAAAAQRALNGIRDATNRVQELDADGRLEEALRSAPECRGVSG